MVIQPFLCAVNWGVVGWVLVGTIALLVVVAAIGRAIAAAFPPNPEHVSSFRKPVAAPAPVVPVAPVAVAPVAPAPAAAPAPSGAIPPEVMAVIAASVAVVLRGQRFSITGVEPAQKTADIERLMSLWSLEGRRQVYSSHSLPR
ncbi:MAG: hypothetical protein IJW39_02540 [Opitutales bacterium]|nr:hypothetical protein [Opitutales bacterium]